MALKCLLQDISLAERKSQGFRQELKLAKIHSLSIKEAFAQVDIHIKRFMNMEELKIVVTEQPYLAKIFRIPAVEKKNYCLSY